MNFDADSENSKIARAGVDSAKLHVREWRKSFVFAVREHRTERISLGCDMKAAVSPPNALISMRPPNQSFIFS